MSITPKDSPILLCHPPPPLAPDPRPLATTDAVRIVVQFGPFSLNFLATISGELLRCGQPAGLGWISHAEESEARDDQTTDPTG